MRYPDWFDKPNDEDEDKPPPTRCRVCRSTDVHWRQQGGSWVLFSLLPGRLHVCDIDGSEFDAVSE